MAHHSRHNEFVVDRKQPLSAAWKDMISDIAGDLNRFSNRSPSLLTFIYSWVLLLGFRFIVAHRVVVFIRKLPFVGRMIGKLYWISTCRRFSSEIAIDAVIGSGCFIPHPYGIVIGKCEIGKMVSILQGVTIGKSGAVASQNPEIGDNVEIGAGATIIGPVTIGSDVLIGANAVVVKTVESRSVVGGVPARVIRRIEGALER